MSSEPHLQPSSNKKTLRLRHILIATFILVSAVPLFFSLQFLNNHTSEKYRAQIEDKLSALSLIAKQRILAVFDTVHSSTELIISPPHLSEHLAQWNLTAAPSDKAEINRIILKEFGQVSSLAEISVYDYQGEFVSSTNPSKPHERLSRLPANKPIIHLFKQGGDLLISSTAILKLDNIAVGYIEIYFSANFLIDMVNDRAGLGQTGEWLIAVRNEAGDAVFAVPLKYDHRAAFHRIIPKNKLDVPITQALLGNEMIMHNAPDYLGKPVLAATRYIPHLDMGLVAKINEDEVSAILTEANRVVIWLEIITISLAALIGAAVSIYIASPIERLRAHTQRLALGDYTDAPDSGGWLEVQKLSEAYTEMAHALKDLNEHLNQKVIERTEELDSVNKKLSEMATKDPLTSLYNRRFFNERLAEEFGRAKRYHSGLALVAIDIDLFKHVNDTLGHAAGDEVLKGVANYLSQSLRDSDIVGRIGGEEFFMIIPSSTETITAFIERMRMDISELTFHFDEQVIQVTCSFGIAMVTESVLSTSELMKNADIALYQAKDAGRNKVILYQQLEENNHSVS